MISHTEVSVLPSTHFQLPSTSMSVQTVAPSDIFLTQFWQQFVVIVYDDQIYSWPLFMMIRSAPLSVQYILLSAQLFFTKEINSWIG